PLVLLGLPFGLAAAAGVLAALRVVVAALFAWLLLRRLEVGEGAALAGALAWGLGGFMLLWLGWPLANVGALLPAVLWALAVAIDRGARRDFVALAIMSATLLLGGHPETQLYVVVLAAAFAMSRARRVAASEGWPPAWRRVVRAGAAAAVGALLVAPVLLPAVS